VRSIFNATIGNPNFIVRIIGINKSGEEQEFNVDHIVAQASSGQNSLDNMQITCARCNRIKSALPHEVFERDAEVIRRILRETN
jgi:CRISPR/Cas system Type II protein with McrA/HNH and RuvC-like nuclease domain